MTTKAEIAARLAESKKSSKNLSRKEALEAVDIFIDSIRHSLMKAEKVSLVGFGTFQLKLKRQRQGRNPRTNQKIDIPPKAMAVFKPGKSFRERVAGDGSQ